MAWLFQLLFFGANLADIVQDLLKIEKKLGRIRSFSGRCMVRYATRGLSMQERKACPRKS
jgi:hypothetical protein